jgi:hypothetical protein
MKVFNVILFILCLLFAALQYNDPDPYIWIPIYLCTALLAWFAFRGKFYVKWMMAAIGMYVLYAAYLIWVPEGVIDWYTIHGSESLVQTMKATKPWIEYTREFGGLLFLILCLTVNIIFYRRTLPRA